jgi:hypothetical protein
VKLGRLGEVTVDQARGPKIPRGHRARFPRRGLDPDKRSQFGAHYTDREKIGPLVDAVIVRPLAAEWDAGRGRIAEAMAERAALTRERSGAGAEPLNWRWREFLGFREEWP